MIQLLNASTAVTPFAPDALRALVVRARAYNARIGVTGMLLHIDGSFLQVLEGKSAVVHALSAKIRTDRRHASVMTLLVRDLETRCFSDSTMACFDGSGRGEVPPGYRPGAGFADLQGDATALLQIVESFRDGRWRALAA